MWLYLLASDQLGIAALKNETRMLRKRMLAEDLENKEVMSIAKENLFVSLRLVTKVFFPSLIASLPVLFFVIWLSSHMTYDRSNDATGVSVNVIPSVGNLEFLPNDMFILKEGEIRLMMKSELQTIKVVSPEGLVYEGRPQAHPVDGVYKKQWWNTFLGNAAGYVENNATVDEIKWGFPRRIYLEGVPSWMSTWEFPFFASLIIVAIVLKFTLRIQ